MGMTADDYGEALRKIVALHNAGRSSLEIHEETKLPAKLVWLVLRKWKTLNKGTRGRRAPNVFPVQGYDSLYVCEHFCPVLRREPRKKRGAYYSATIARRTEEDRAAVMAKVGSVQQELGNGTPRTSIMRMVIAKYSISVPAATRLIDVAMQFNMAQLQVTRGEATANALTYWTTERQLARRMMEQGQAMLTQASAMMQKIQTALDGLDRLPGMTKKERSDYLRSLSSSLVEASDLMDKGQRIYDTAKNDIRAIQRHEESLRKLHTLLPSGGGTGDGVQDESLGRTASLPGFEEVAENEAFTIAGAHHELVELTKTPEFQKILRIDQKPKEPE